MGADTDGINGGSSSDLCLKHSFLLLCTSCFGISSSSSCSCSFPISLSSSSFFFPSIIHFLFFLSSSLLTFPSRLRTLISLNCSAISLSTVFTLISGLLWKVFLHMGHWNKGLVFQYPRMQVWQKLCPHGMETGLVKTSRQMEQCTCSSERFPAVAMPTHRRGSVIFSARNRPLNGASNLL